MKKTINASSRGTVLRARVDLDYSDLIVGMMKRDFKFKTHVLGKIGKYSRLALQKGWLSSESSIDSMLYKGFAKTRQGRYKVVNRYNRRGIIFTSFPLNLFEFGRTYRGTGVDTSPFARKRHVKEPARKILTVKFRNWLDAHVSGIANAAVRKVINLMDRGR